MARPVKWRKVEYIPNVQYFAPDDAGGDVPDENIIRIEEMEAVRLKDLEGMEQEDCAVKMEVSRQTFQRILGTARSKITDSLVNGKAIRIEGGNYTRNICPVKCADCLFEWKESYENFEKLLKGELNCPHCSSKRIICARPDKMNFCRKNCWRHGRNESGPQGRRAGGRLQAGKQERL
ncbi:MAG: DUF134 domain-containing protein [Eubacteriales bacterium]|nr:DUF134 domain-containing protein [Eubacteriales bacterium]